MWARGLGGRLVALSLRKHPIKCPLCARTGPSREVSFWSQAYIELLPADIAVLFSFRDASQA